MNLYSYIQQYQFSQCFGTRIMLVWVYAFASILWGITFNWLMKFWTRKKFNKFLDRAITESIPLYLIGKNYPLWTGTCSFVYLHITYNVLVTTILLRNHSWEERVHCPSTRNNQMLFSSNCRITKGWTPAFTMRSGQVTQTASKNVLSQRFI